MGKEETGSAEELDEFLDSEPSLFKNAVDGAFLQVSRVNRNRNPQSTLFENLMTPALAMFLETCPLQRPNQLTACERWQATHARPQPPRSDEFPLGSAVRQLEDFRGRGRLLPEY